jgi:hypothetical protein
MFSAPRSARRLPITGSKKSGEKTAPKSASERLERLRAEATRERAAAKAERANARTREARPSRGSARRPRGKPRRWADPRVLREIAWLGIREVGLVLLPFVTLVGGSVWSYRLLGLPTWGALAVAILLTTACLTAVVLRLVRALGHRYRVRTLSMRMGMRIALPVVAIYCGFLLLHLARENAKTDTVRSYFTSVHPLMRIALGTAILADPAIVLTDTRRGARDYVGMALPPRERSLHFTQLDGYVHAVDLRTNGRSWIRNALTRAYFTLMGFTTLRHTGTADHLHVSLPLR